MITANMDPKRPQNLKVMYGFTLAFIALTILASSFIMQRGMKGHDGDLRVMNLSGRQRMLSQQLTKSILVLERMPPGAGRSRIEQEIAVTFADWKAVHQGLRHGNTLLSLPQRENSPEIEKLINEMEPYHATMVEALNLLFDRIKEGRSDPAVIHATTDVMLANEPRFLSLMDKITRRFEKEATERLSSMQLLVKGFLAVGLALLLFGLLCVFRPSFKQLAVRDQAEERIDDTMNYIRTILRTSPVGIETFKATGETVLANVAAARIVGASVDALKQQNFRDIESWRRCGLLALAERALATGQEQHGDFHLTSTFGKQVYLDCFFVPFMFSGEQHLMLELIDITERKHAALERDRHPEELAAQRTANLTQAEAEAARSLVEAMLEATDNGILLVNNVGKITLTNKRFARMWRIPDELVAAENDEALLAHVLEQLEDPRQFPDKMQELLHKPEAATRDRLLFRDDRVFDCFSHPHRLGNEVVGRVWSFLDISEQYRAEQRVLQLSQTITDELERSEQERQQLQVLLGAIPDLVWMKDPDGVFLSCNPAFGQLMGAPATEIPGKTSFDFFPADVAETFRRDDLVAAESTTPIVREEWMTYKSDGRRVLLETVKSAVRGQNGNLLGVIGIARDITKMRTLLEELDTARLDAQRSNETKSLFLANMSHEIRTPMNAIIGMSDLCLATRLNERQRNYISKIKVASDSLLHIINDILDFSKIEAGKLRIERTKFVLQTVLEQLSSVTALRAESQGVEITYDIGQNNQLLIGDPLRLGQVLTNLVTNALKFSAGGNVVIKVEEVSAGATEVELHFSVKDEGIGMSPEHVAILFQPFTQADASTTRHFGGTGLGLAICRHLVELMKGRIWVESELGVGSTFHFTARFENAGHDRRQLIMTFADTLAEQLHRPVLVVDDNPIAQLVLAGLLGHLGLPVHTASGGAEALSVVAAHGKSDYLACFVDWRMPEMDGIETIQRLRAAFRDLGADPVPRMILVTAHSLDENTYEYNIDDDFDSLLAKPVTVRDVHLELRRCLGVSGESTPDVDRRKAASLQWSRFRNLDVLLVEDIEVNQEVIRELLAGVGLSSRLARDGEQALAEVARKTPDVILMDCRMPVMDGFTATRLLRQNPAWHSVPIIALTANAMAEDKERCLAAGMNAHLAKPIRMKELYERLVHCVPDIQETPETIPKVMLNSVTPPALPQFPGIDTAVGLAHVGGHLSQLFRVLKLFRDNQGHKFAGQISEALAAGEWEVAERLAHSLKGVSHTLGALDLAESAEALYTAASCHDNARCAALVSQVVARLQLVTSGLEDLDCLLEAGARSRIMEESTSAYAPMLEKLAEMLAQRDTEAVDLIQDLTPTFSAGPHRTEWSALVCAIESYDFNSAAGALESLLNTLNRLK